MKRHTADRETAELISRTKAETIQTFTLSHLNFDTTRCQAESRANPSGHARDRDRARARVKRNCKRYTRARLWDKHLPLESSVVYCPAFVASVNIWCPEFDQLLYGIIGTAIHSTVEPSIVDTLGTW